MDLRPLGKSSLEASRLGLGLMTMSGVYGKGDDQESIETIRHAIDRGVNFLDSSDMYGWGQNEELLGRALKGSGLRNRVLVTTKFGQVRGEGGRNLVNGRPEYVQQACDASLKRLGVDVIDLYSQHRVDPSVPIEDTVGAMARLIQQGKVRAIGLSEAAPATIRRAHAVHPISTIQMEYSLLYRKEAEETLPLCRELGITYVAYSPLGRGFLTGSFKTASDIPEGDRRRDHPRFQEANFPRNRELVEKIERIAQDKGCTPAQLVLAWLLAQGEDILPIPGTKRKARVDENLGALKVKLDKQDLDRISAAVPVGAAAGTRYPEPQMKGVYL
jgi:aryl-alcohol dehydrogenase-like predicted oxidoreductase